LNAHEFSLIDKELGKIAIKALETKKLKPKERKLDGAENSHAELRPTRLRLDASTRINIHGMPLITYSFINFPNNKFLAKMYATVRSNMRCRSSGGKLPSQPRHACLQLPAAWRSRLVAQPVIVQSS
jgi:hypothetical protein